VHPRVRTISVCQLVNSVNCCHTRTLDVHSLLFNARAVGTQNRCAHGVLRRRRCKRIDVSKPARLQKTNAWAHSPAAVHAAVCLRLPLTIRCKVPSKPDALRLSTLQVRLAIAKNVAKATDQPIALWILMLRFHQPPSACELERKATKTFRAPSDSCLRHSLAAHWRRCTLKTPRRHSKRVQKERMPQGENKCARLAPGWPCKERPASGTEAQVTSTAIAQSWLPSRRCVVCRAQQSESHRNEHGGPTCGANAARRAERPLGC